MAQNIVIPHIQIPQTPDQINQVFTIQNIPATPIKPRLGPFNDVPAEDDKSIQNLNLIFAMIDNLD
jgi:hypothetical protein